MNTCWTKTAKAGSQILVDTRSYRTWRKGSVGQAGLVRKVPLLSQLDAGGEMEEGVPRGSARERQGLVRAQGPVI